jgi:hypothetical protein
VVDAPWIDTWRGSTHVKPADVVSALRKEGKRLPAGHAEAFDSLCSELLQTAESDIRSEED